MATKDAPKKVDVKTISKKEIISLLSERASLTKKDSEKAVNGLLEIIKEEVGNNNKVTFIGFGSFSMKHRGERSGRNPQTGEAITIAPKNTLGFHSTVTY